MLASILVELRPRLRVCQIHANFKPPLSDPALESMKVSIASTNSIQLSWLDKTQTISLHSLNFVPDSVSSLFKEFNALSFRLQTNPESRISGSFSTEVLFPFRHITHISSIPIAGIKYCILCRNCRSKIVKDLVLKRVLPLPSTSWKEVGWFCHSHGDEKNPSSLLAPGPTDCFHASGSWIVHSTVLMESALKPGNQLFCVSCSLQLGESLKLEATLWNFAVIWQSEKFSEDILTLEQAMERDFIDIIQSAITPCGAGNKLFISSSDTSISPLSLCLHDSPLNITSLALETPCLETVTPPDPRPAIHILYRLQDLPQDDSQTLVVPPPVLTKGTKLLECANLMLPEKFRSTEGFLISFVYLPRKSS